MGNCRAYLWITDNFSSLCVFHKISSTFYDFVLTSCGWLADAFSTRWGKNCLAIGPSGLWWTLLPSRSTRRRTWTQIHGEKKCGWLQNDLKVLITTHHESEFHHISLTDSFQVLWTFYSFLCSLESFVVGWEKNITSPNSQIYQWHQGNLVEGQLVTVVFLKTTHFAVCFLK